jgi:hypothetical protein
MVYGRYNELVNGVYKPTYNWGAPSCRADDLWNILMISHQHINNRDQMGFDGRMFENGVYLQVAIYIPGQ